MNLSIATELLLNYRPRRKLRRHWLARSAVALHLNESAAGDLQVLMIRRAERPGDPWSGHMAFPGGRSEAQDADSLATAQRETLEEVGLDSVRDGNCLGRLSDLQTRPGLVGGSMIITPYVFSLHLEPELHCNEEVDEIHWVPLGFLADRSNRQKMHWKPGGIPIELPCYFYSERRIWGLSLMMLDELLDVLF